MASMIDNLHFRCQEAFRVRPILTGIVVGLLSAGAILLCATAIALFLLLLDYLFPMGGGAGFSLLIAFLIGPILVLAGAPWSFYMLGHHGSMVSTLLGIGAADLINGSVVGLIIGVTAKLRHWRESRSEK